MSFRRLTPGHAIALIAALLLLLALAPDWYTDKVGEHDRQFQKQVVPQLNTQTVPSVAAQAGQAAETHEKNAWQASALIDRLILIGLLVSAGLAIAAAFLRAAGRATGPPSLSAIATITGLVTSMLVAYRILQPPGFNDTAIVKWGAPAGLLCVGLVAFGSRMASRAEREPGAAPGGENPAEAPPAPTATA